MANAPEYPRRFIFDDGEEEEMPDENESKHMSFLFEYTYDFGCEYTMVLSRIAAPSDIPLPEYYLETLRVAYYITVDDRYRIVLLKPNFESVAQISYAKYPKCLISLLQDNSEELSTEPTLLKLVAPKKHKDRFVSDDGDVITWEHHEDDDRYILYVQETVKYAGRDLKQTRTAGGMKRTKIPETDAWRVTIDVDTTYISERLLISTAVAVLKKSALRQKQKQRRREMVGLDRLRAKAPPRSIEGRIRI